jgi:hypothetical protein
MDVTANGTAVTNVTTGQINEGCTPGGVTLSGGNFHSGAGLIPLAPDGSFRIDFDYRGNFSDGTPYTGHFTIAGKFSGSSVTGTLSDSTNFTFSGTAYTCGSGVQTWTATRTG